MGVTPPHPLRYVKLYKFPVSKHGHLAFLIYADIVVFKAQLSKPAQHSSWSGPLGLELLVEDQFFHFCYYATTP
jgi:hypothetical protein